MTAEDINDEYGSRVKKWDSSQHKKELINE